MIINNMAEKLETTVEIEHNVVNDDGSIEKIIDRIVCEHNIDVYINEVLVMKLVCTPDNLVEMVVGRMITEGLVNNINEIEKIYICEYGSRAKVFLNKQLEAKKTVAEEPTCCTDNKQIMTGNNRFMKLEKVAYEKYSSDIIFGIVNEFGKGTKIHKATKGTHSCVLFVNGKFEFFAEDIGRHNALDKVIGYIYMNNLSVSDCVVFTTGRVPTDMMKKVIAARIPILVSKAVPTDSAIMLAKEYNVVLICKAWPDRYEIFNS